MGLKKLFYPASSYKTISRIIHIRISKHLRTSKHNFAYSILIGKQDYTLCYCDRNYLCCKDGKAVFVLSVRTTAVVHL